MSAGKSDPNNVPGMQIVADELPPSKCDWASFEYQLGRFSCENLTTLLNSDAIEE